MKKQDQLKNVNETFNYLNVKQYLRINIRLWIQMYNFMRNI